MLCRALRHQLRLAVRESNNDRPSRVDPVHAKKMAALMQAEAANGTNRERPILLRIESGGAWRGKPAAD